MRGRNRVTIDMQYKSLSKSETEDSFNALVDFFDYLERNGVKELDSYINVISNEVHKQMQRTAPQPPDHFYATGRLKKGITITGSGESRTITSSAISPSTGVEYAPIQEGLTGGRNAEYADIRVTPYFYNNIHSTLEDIESEIIPAIEYSMSNHGEFPTAREIRNHLEFQQERLDFFHDYASDNPGFNDYSFDAPLKDEWGEDTGRTLGDFFGY